MVISRKPTDIKPGTKVNGYQFNMGLFNSRGTLLATVITTVAAAALHVAVAGPLPLSPIIFVMVNLMSEALYYQYLMK